MVLIDKTVYLKKSNKFGTKLISTEETVDEDLLFLVKEAYRFLSREASSSLVAFSICETILKHGISFFKQDTKTITKVGWFFNKTGRIYINSELISREDEIRKKYVLPRALLVIAIVLHEAIHAYQHDNSEHDEYEAWEKEYAFMRKNFPVLFNRGGKVERFYLEKLRKFRS
jgi:hypothetical protein